jgi:mono/diheme cytochrome c family protein
LDSLRKLYPWFALLGLAVGGLVLAGYYKDQHREWKRWQQKYIAQEVSRATTPEQKELARAQPIEIKQIVLPGLQRVDRCVSCHLAVEDPSYAGYGQPLAYHPNHAQHPFEKFGCTICHQGQGRATDREAAHGHVKYWDHPMLPMKYIQSSCVKCHSVADLPQADELARGRRVFEEQGCIGCHKLGGVGGNIGPELDKVGAKRSPEWLARHFRTPGKVVPGSGMPPVKRSEADIEALTLFMLGQTGEPLSDYYVSMRTIPGPGLGQRLFEEKGCIGCHSVGGHGGKVGPALDGIAKRRSNDWIAQHFRDPAAVTPGTVMPKFNFTEAEIRALTSFLVSLTETNQVGLARVSEQASPVERGRAVYLKFGCGGCHGPNGQGGVPNPNAKPNQMVPALTGAKDASDVYLDAFITEGQPTIARLNEKGPKPPLYMPAWGDKISEGERADLIKYLQSLKPE